MFFALYFPSSRQFFDSQDSKDVLSPYNGICQKVELTVLGLSNEVVFTRSDYVQPVMMEHILAALTPPNRLVMEICLASGLRVSDALNLRTEQLRSKSAKLPNRISVRELKTGKTRRITLPRELFDRLLAQAGKIYVFPGRLDYRKHRSRQAVYKDIRRAARLFRLPEDLRVSPHSARKIYAVGKYQSSGSLQHVKELLNHTDEAVTILYAMADELTARHYTPKA